MARGRGEASQNVVPGLWMGLTGQEEGYSGIWMGLICQEKGVIRHWREKLASRRE